MTDEATDLEHMAGFAASHAEKAFLLKTARRLRELVAKNTEDTKLIRVLAEALGNLFTWDARARNPFGHDCQWCVHCVDRVRHDAQTALSTGRARLEEKK